VSGEALPSYNAGDLTPGRAVFQGRRGRRVEGADPGAEPAKIESPKRRPPSRTTGPQDRLDDRVVRFISPTLPWKKGETYAAVGAPPVLPPAHVHPREADGAGRMDSVRERKSRPFAHDRLKTRVMSQWTDEESDRIEDPFPTGRRDETTSFCAITVQVRESRTPSPAIGWIRWPSGSKSWESTPRGIQRGALGSRGTLVVKPQSLARRPHGRHPATHGEACVASITDRWR